MCRARAASLRVDEIASDTTKRCAVAMQALKVLAVAAEGKQAGGDGGAELVRSKLHARATAAYRQASTSFERTLQVCIVWGLPFLFGIEGGEFTSTTACFAL